MTPRPKLHARRVGPQQGGFTLLELVITLFLVIILAAMAAPAMREITIRSVVSSNTNDLVAALNLARSEAIKRGRDVALIAQNANWSEGWIMQQVGAAETLNAHDAIKADYRILGAATGAGAVSDRVIFTATGALRTATAYDFSVCRPGSNPGDADSRRILIAATGTIRSRPDTSGSPAGDCT